MSSLKHVKVRVVLACLCVFALLVAVAVVIGRTREAWFIHNPAALTPYRAATGAGDGLAPGSNQAHALLSSGRFEEAFALYRARGPDRFESNDLLALGLALLDRERLVLGWAALEAARRIDPRNAPVRGLSTDFKPR